MTLAGISATAVAKKAPLVAPTAGALLADAIGGADALRVVAVMGGLALGAMWRAGSLKSEGKDWAAVRSDMAVSVLIGGANAVVTLALVDYFGAGILFAMAIGVAVGATGVRVVPELRDAVWGLVKRRALADVAVTPVTIRAADPVEAARADPTVPHDIPPDMQAQLDAIDRKTGGA